MNRQEYNSYMNTWYHRNRDKVCARRRELYQQNRGHYLEVQRQARQKYKEKIRAYNKNYRQNHREWDRQVTNKSLWKLKITTLSHYSDGTLKCTHCGEDDIRVLQLDHIDGGGNEQRQKIGKGSGKVYRWLRDQGYPEGYQVLCANCNIRKTYLDQNLYCGRV